MTDVQLIEADLSVDAHQRAILSLLDGYVQEPIIRGKSLPDEVRRRLIPALKAHPTTVVLLALGDDEPAGLAICFMGFSTFAARPLLNVHDLYVAPGFRNLGVGNRLLDAVEQKARGLGCCKVTLEVDQQNLGARKLYRRCGYTGDDLNAQDADFFMAKPVVSS